MQCRFGPADSYLWPLLRPHNHVISGTKISALPTKFYANFPDPKHSFHLANSRSRFRNFAGRNRANFRLENPSSGDQNFHYCGADFPSSRSKLLLFLPPSSALTTRSDSILLTLKLSNLLTLKSPTAPSSAPTGNSQQANFYPSGFGRRKFPTRRDPWQRPFWN